MGKPVKFPDLDYEIYELFIEKEFKFLPISNSVLTEMAKITRPKCQKANSGMHDQKSLFQQTSNEKLILLINSKVEALENKKKSAKHFFEFFRRLDEKFQERIPY